MGNRKRQSAQAAKEAKKQLAFAKLNNCPTSPRKMRWLQTKFVEKTSTKPWLF